MGIIWIRSPGLISVFLAHAHDINWRCQWPPISSPAYCSYSPCLLFCSRHETLITYRHQWPRWGRRNNFYNWRSQGSIHHGSGLRSLNCCQLPPQSVWQNRYTDSQYAAAAAELPVLNTALLWPLSFLVLETVPNNSGKFHHDDSDGVKLCKAVPGRIVLCTSRPRTAS